MCGLVSKFDPIIHNADNLEWSVEFTSENHEKNPKNGDLSGSYIRVKYCLITAA